MCSRGRDELLLGTISWMLVSLDISTLEQSWQIQLHDAILSVCCYDDDEVGITRIFSGLADGTVAVVEVKFSFLFLIVSICRRGFLNIFVPLKH